MNYKTNKQSEIDVIAAMMIEAKLSTKFVEDATKAAYEFDGVYDLFLIWRDEDDKYERQETIKTIKECVQDIQRIS